MAFDTQKLLDVPAYALDQLALFSGLLDFLEFSEHNIEWQKREALFQLKKDEKNLGHT
jgi:hypothetical protein